MSGPRLGAHMSIAGGMPQAIARALSVEATALQVFVKSANQWAARPFADGEAEAFRRATRDADLLRHTLAHASYLINLASPAEALWEKSVASLRLELSRCRDLDIPWLVVHPGSHVGSGLERGIERVARALDRVLASVPDGPGVLLEITAGQGAHLGSRFEELAEILRRTERSDRVGVCFDTCHALAAGYDFRDAASYERTMGELDRTIGLDRLRGFHLNDSKGKLGSRIDRHEQIGQGQVGLEGFRLLLSDPRFADAAMVLETEKGDDLAEDRVNLGVLRSLVRR
ncbi:MAG TPA: deoxyribonuclease IV [Candidatus Polarisedimenticolaceae bacterium]|nr:deoxyribonuclease IV [Candidatus Polarisedimenticolaceae bacterium]